MKGIANFEGVNEQTGFNILPEGEYNFQVIVHKEGYTKNKDPMITIKLLCMDSDKYGYKVYDRIIIPNPNSPGYKIAGRTKHFLHCIGEPYEGNIVNWDSDKWNGKNIKAHIIQEEYDGKPQNKVKNYLLPKHNSTHNNTSFDKNELSNKLPDLPF